MTINSQLGIPGHLGRRLGVFSPFNPRRIAGCKLWLDASKHTGVADGGSLSGAPDYSPAGNNVVNYNTAPTYQATGLNNRPSYRFGGAGGLKTAAAILSDDAFTLLAVIKGSAQINKPIVTQNASDAGRTNLLGTDTTNGNLARIFFNNGANREANSTDVILDGTAKVVMTRSDGAGFWTPSVNGGTEGSTLSGQTVTPSTAVTTVGATSDGSGYFTGDISELVLFDRNLDPGEIKKLIRYLGRKWFVGLNS